ncbi:hypothetical protein JCM19238_2457 [Vibrio ponticus]|nr:hypothetical protein JCM19238_2457 [Vibrio ponticus]
MRSAEKPPLIWLNILLFLISFIIAAVVTLGMAIITVTIQPIGYG